MAEKKQKTSFDPYKLVGIPAVILMLVVSVLLMWAIRDVREKELRISLQNIDEGSGGKSIGLIARYKLIRQRYSSGKETAADYLAEGELMAVLSSDFDQPRPLQFKLLEKPALLVVNIVGALVGAAPVTNLNEDRGYKILETAYFYERKREFTRAIQVYTVAEDFFDSEIETKAYVWLHKGFCLSLIGKREEALQYYARVSQELPHSEMAFTADVLASFLKDVNNRLLRVDQMGDSVEKGVFYYRLMAYTKAIETLNKSENQSKGQELYFYRGRSHEEIGQTKKAIADYRRVIKLNKKSYYGKSANRRLYLLGAFYEDDKKLTNESETTAEKIGDKDFIKKTKKLVAATSTGRVAKLAEDESTRDTVAYIDDELEDLPETEAKPEPPLKKVEPEKKVEPPKPKEKKKPTKKVEKKKQPKKPKKPKKPVKTEEKLPKKKLTDPSLSRTQRKQMLIKKYKKVDKIFTQDGNVFVGAVINESGNKITIVTVFGVIKVPQEKISMRLKVNSKTALK